MIEVPSQSSYDMQIALSLEMIALYNRLTFLLQSYTIMKYSYLCPAFSPEDMKAVYNYFSLVYNQKNKPGRCLCVYQWYLINKYMCIHFYPKISIRLCLIIIIHTPCLSVSNLQITPALEFVK